MAIFHDTDVVADEAGGLWTADSVGTTLTIAGPSGSTVIDVPEGALYVSIAAKEGVWCVAYQAHDGTGLHIRTPFLHQAPGPAEGIAPCKVRATNAGFQVVWTDSPTSAKSATLQLRADRLDRPIQPVPGRPLGSSQGIVDLTAAGEPVWWDDTHWLPIHGRVLRGAIFRSPFTIGQDQDGAGALIWDGTQWWVASTAYLPTGRPRIAVGAAGALVAVRGETDTPFIPQGAWTRLGVTIPDPVDPTDPTDPVEDPVAAPFLNARQVEIIEDLYSLFKILAHGDDEQRRLLTMKIAQQLRFEFGAAWGTKRAEPGRPLSKDAIAVQVADKLYAWDWQNGDTRLPQVRVGTPAMDITGQVFAEVVAVNHLSVPAPDDADDPDDEIGTAAEFIVNELDATERELKTTIRETGDEVVAQVVHALQEEVDDLAAQVAALEALLGRVLRAVEDLRDRPAPAVKFPDYSGKILGFTATLAPKVQP